MSGIVDATELVDILNTSIAYLRKVDPKAKADSLMLDEAYRRVIQVKAKLYDLKDRGWVVIDDELTRSWAEVVG